MPLKLNVGLSRKVGEANYGSRGASVNLELELDSGLAGEPDRLRERIQHLFGLAKSAVDDELNGSAAAHTRESAGNGAPRDRPPEGNGVPRSGSPRGATQSQVRAIHAIARRQRVDLGPLLRDRFRAYRVDDLTLREASLLIDELQGTGNGQEDRR